MINIYREKPLGVRGGDGTYLSRSYIVIQDQWEDWFLSVHHLQGEPRQQAWLGV